MISGHEWDTVLHDWILKHALHVSYEAAHELLERSADLGERGVFAHAARVSPLERTADYENLLRLLAEGV